MSIQARYALYFAPPRTSGWWRFGARWLGRDAATGAPVEQTGVPGVTLDEFRALTAAPRAYGFHATLKAPFVLREGTTRKALVEALAVFCSLRAPFPLPPLEVERLDDFLALVPAGRESRVNDLAADCVREFDAFRAPPPPAERERYGRRGLSARQDRYFAQWGYPYVLTEFRFHLTLTGSLDATPPHHMTALIAAARAAVSELNGAPLRVDAVSLFEQTDPASPFLLRRRFPFRARKRRA
jgi:putative phosphonate metabolism protein